MKNTAGPLAHYSSPRNQKPDTHHKTPRGLNYFIAAAKKVTQVFRFFLPEQRKDTAKGASADDANRNNSQVKGLTYSSDYSTESKSKSSRFKSSSSYNSYSTSSSKSRQVATINFSLKEIYKATENFSPANKIGEGGSGMVYKGKLKDGSIVAVKRARKHKYEKHLLLEFKNEILTLSKIEHMNLVKLFGYIEHAEERIIVVEYVGNGTLRDHLDGKWGNDLEMAERLDIAIDVSHALTYLHTYTDPPIIHRDIKASNILITDKLRAKVADFGFARMTTEEDPSATHISTQVKGTAGYLDPEYLRTYQLTEKSDVYSFGVLLVEMMTGRHPIERTKQMKERVTIRWAMQSLKAGEAILVMDPRLRRSPASYMAVEKILKLAHDCLAPTKQSRPSMKNCAEVLWGIRKEFREKAISSASPASTSQHSSHYPTNARKSRHTLFGIEDDDSYRFVSA